MKRILYRHILLLFAVAACVSCSPHSGGKLSLRQAQHVVAQADSLWHEGQMYGVDAGDSATLAQAYETLNSFVHCSSSFVHCTPSLCTSFAHACYHYGRLLRAKENPVEAMQAFIAATHSRTRDYHILGRVYSNMGSICHLAGEFQLSYDMYEKSAEMFLKNGDTLNYYYALNDMAYELAEQGSKNEAYYLVSLIEKNCFNIEVITKTLETKAEACLYVNQYDSVLYYSDIICSNRNYTSNIFLLRAKAFSFLGQKDSAVYYANYVLYMSDELFNKNSALYILTHDDDSKNMHEIRMTAADRSDVQKQIEIRQGKLSQAVQLLEQDLVHKPDKRWIFTLIAILLFTVTFIFLIHLWKKRKQHRRIIQDIHAKEQLQTQLVHEIDNLSTIQKSHQHQIIDDIEETCRLLNGCENIKTQLCWKDYSKMCELVNQRLYGLAELLQSYHLSEKEIRLCVLVMLKASTEDMVNLIPYAKSGLGKFKYTTARKLSTSTAQMRTFLLNILC